MVIELLILVNLKMYVFEEGVIEKKAVAVAIITSVLLLYKYMVIFILKANG